MFDPQHITPAVSLNRVTITHTPDTEINGKKSYSLVSAEALTEMIRQHAPELKLNPDDDPHHLRLALDELLQEKNLTAEKIAERYGRNFGYLLLTLKCGFPETRAARREWDESYWNFYANLEHVILGGGLISGILGQYVKKYIQQVFQEANVPAYNVEIATHARHLPLLGAARYAPPGVKAALLFDFGGTWIKRAIAFYERGQLKEIRLLPSYPALYTGEALLNHMAAVITETAQQENIFNPILCSVAAYMDNGILTKQQGGIYPDLWLLGYENLHQALIERVHLKGDIFLKLIHDGTAAASVYAGMKNAVVITVGTALGTGFPPIVASLRPLSPRFLVR